MKDLIDAVELLFRITQKIAWGSLDNESKQLMRDARGKLDRARDTLNGRDDGGKGRFAKDQPSGVEDGTDKNWKADSAEEKALTRGLCDWFNEEPEGEQLDEFQRKIHDSVLVKLEKYGCCTKKQLAVLKEAWKKITGDKPFPKS